MAEIRVVHADQRDTGTLQTAGMDRAEGVGAKTVGAKTLWLGHVTMSAGMRSGAHHHADTESAIYIISGSARFRFGDKLENTVEAGAGDFIFVPPLLVHQEINASQTDPVVMIVGRGSVENMVVNVHVPQAALEG